MGSTISIEFTRVYYKLTYGYQPWIQVFQPFKYQSDAAYRFKSSLSTMATFSIILLVICFLNDMMATMQYPIGSATKLVCPLFQVSSKYAKELITTFLFHPSVPRGDKSNGKKDRCMNMPLMSEQLKWWSKGGYESWMDLGAITFKNFHHHYNPNSKKIDLDRDRGII